MCAFTLCFFRGALAQLVRAPPCHGGGCGFEPRRLRGDHLLDRSLGFFGLAVTFCGSRSALTAQPLLMTMFCREKKQRSKRLPLEFLRLARSSIVLRTHGKVLDISRRGSRCRPRIPAFRTHETIASRRCARSTLTFEWLHPTWMRMIA